MSSAVCSCSIVIYNNPQAVLRAVLSSFLDSVPIVQLDIIDNSPTPHLSSLFLNLPVRYHFSNKNLGYGRAHNRSILNLGRSKYHLILNPDVIIHSRAIEYLIDFMDANPDIGIVCPKILNEDGSIQRLNKRYPTFVVLFIRRFLPNFMNFVVKGRIEHYEMNDIGYENICDVECISGCFMFCRTDVLKAVGGFDDRYFMYLEDFDLCRKVQQAGYRTVYYPYATVTHLWERASHKSLKMTWVHIKSAIKYFNKWGWKLF